MHEIVRTTAAILSQPRRDPADSFVLHAPLELLARVGLLPHVPADRMNQALTRVRLLGELFDAWGPPVATPPWVPSGGASGGATPTETAARLVAAIDAGDLDATDAAVLALARTTTAGELPGLLADAVLARLAAAAHAPILLALLPTVAGGTLPLELLRQPARELARQPQWRLTWFHDAAGGGPADLGEAVAALAPLPDPASTFIYPLMSGVEAAGVAEWLGAATSRTPPAKAMPVLQREAARRMLIESDDHVPYGWTHCLTMPQAALAIAPRCREPQHAVAVAATYVAGFRCPLGRATGEYTPPPPASDLPTALATAPALAPAAVWHAPTEAMNSVVATLAAEASVRHDAHLVKYTLACIRAATADRAGMRLYLAAAARLLAWWIAHPDPRDHTA
jgi:hypothetical protein